MPPRPRAELDIVRAATRTLRKAVTAAAPDRTRLLREVADLLVDLRALHTGTDGETDWAGKSYAYRDAVRDIYAGAGLPSEGSDSTKTALRYHIGNALRDRLSPDELEAAGLSRLDPRDRQAKRRAEVEDAMPQSADQLISGLALLARRLDNAKGKVTQHDLDRAIDAAARLEDWLATHRGS